MADRIPVVAPKQFTRDGNTDHRGAEKPIAAGTRFSYGTAGFREHADRMPFIAYRVGYLASLRARVTGAAIGVMITASHNPEQDNGVKIIDPHGEMLVEEWEEHATELMNVTDEQFPTAVRALETQLGKDGVPPDNAAGSVVLCGRDTRVSGGHLADAVQQGATLFGTTFEDHGLLTTPQLHYIVAVRNSPAWGLPPGEEGYYENLARNGVTELYSMIPKKRLKYTNRLHLDCANGVGAPKMRQLAAQLPEGLLDIDFRNEDGQLNHECGADFVKISRVAPAGFDDVPVNERCAVFDGDADRLVYFYKKEDGTIELLDGDKIASLIAKFYMEHLSELALLNNPTGPTHTTTFAIVQTAYANGASTAYMKETLGTSPIFVPTGVKHLHHAAAKHECGIYFEANGHGTATFADSFYTKLEWSFCREKDNAAHRLWQMSRVINKFVGDAMADLLAVELILRYYDWSVQEWAAMYEDAPSKQIKVPVTDRSRFKTTSDETRLTEPTALQTTIDELVAADGDKARAFVRPSGTENIVRVYAESASQAAADRLAGDIEKAVKALAL